VVVSGFVDMLADQEANDAFRVGRE
jgi:hypothetical protein